MIPRDRESIEYGRKENANGEGMDLKTGRRSPFAHFRRPMPPKANHLKSRINTKYGSGIMTEGNARQSPVGDREDHITLLSDYDIEL